MPELPEVEVVRLGLVPAVTGARVAAVTVFDERSLRRHPGPSEDFIDRLTGATLAAPKAAPADVSPSNSFGGEAVRSAAKSLEALVVHLGMSGQVLLLGQDAADDRLTRIRIDLEHPEHGPLRLNFVDQRIFGSMAIDELVEAIGAAPESQEPLDPHFDDRRFLSALTKRKTGIKRAMLDQTLISGIGNIYADEALWAARIHHEQPTNTLSRPRAVTLLADVRTVLAKALGEGGTSFDTQYLNVNGESGYFSHSLNVYGQQGKACQRCGRPIVRERFMNRGSHFCPHCQRVR